VGDYECDDLNLENELDYPQHKDFNPIGNIDFGAMAQELGDKDDDNAEDALPSKKRKRRVDEDDMPEDLSGPSRPKKQLANRRPTDSIACIDFADSVRKLNEEEPEDAETIPPPAPQKRKRGADDDGMHGDTNAPPAQKIKPTGRARLMTRFCGVQSPSLHDPPLPPKKGGFPATGAVQYHCSRCDIALSRLDTVRKHFEKCIEFNGNPDALKWTDYRVVARTREEIFESSKRGKTVKSASKTHLPTPAFSPVQAPVIASALAAPVLPVPSPSPAPSQQAQQPRQPRAQKQLTAVCGVYSHSLHDPPVQPASYGKNQSKNRYHCPRCDYALSVSDSVRKHFLPCIEKNGNPDALKLTDYRVDAVVHVAEDRVQGLVAQQANEVHENTHGPSPMSLSAAAKRKHREDDYLDQTCNETSQPRADAGRTQEKRQKRTYKPQVSARDVAKSSAHKHAGQPHSSSGGLFPTTNPDPFFERTIQPWEKPGPGLLSEIDMCTWQRRPGNTIPLATELALLRGEIFSIGKSRWADPDYEEKKKKKL